MKRPALLYLVALWAYVQSIFGAVLPVRLISHLMGGSSTLPQEMLGAISIAMIVLLVFLIQLRPLARITTIVLLGMATLMLLKMLITSILLKFTSATGQPLPLKGQIAIVVILALNGLCMFYLARPEFADLCRKRRAEVEQRRQA